jgi:PAS domain S-box-containing protein
VKDSSKTKKQLIEELVELRSKLSVSGEESAEESVREAAGLLDLICAHAPDGIVLMDKDFNFIRVNDSYARFCKMEKADFLGRNHFEMFPSSFEEEVKPYIKEKKIYKSYNRSFVFPDDPERGTTYWDLQLVPLLDSGGEVEFLLFTLRDVTEHSVAEGDLRLQSAILKNMAEGAFLVRVSDVLIVYTNPKFEEMFGYEPGEMLGKHVSIVNAPTENSPEKIASEIMASLKRDGVWSGEVKNIRKDGTTFWCYANVSSFLHPEHGEVWLSVHTDITARKEREEELSMLTGLLNASNDSVMVSDAEEGRLIYVNEKACSTLGYDRDELLAMRVMDIEELFSDEESWRRHVDEVRGEGQMMIEGSHKRLDGTTFPVEVNVKYISMGGKEYLFAIHRDITERKRAEKELKRSKENLLRAQKVAKIGSWYLNLDEDNLIWSEENYKIFGVPSGTPMSYKKFLEIVHPEDREYVDRKWKACIKGEPYDIEHRLLINNKVKWVREKAELNHDKDGRPVSGIGITQDITKRKLVDEELRTFALVVDQSPASTIILNKDLKIEYANQACIETTGYSLNELMGEHIDILRSGDHSTEFYDEIWTTVGSGNIWRGDVSSRRKDGKKILELISISPVKAPDGEITRFLSVKVDDTERRRAEEELQESEQSLSMAQQVAQIGSWDWNVKENTLTWSDETYRQFGFRPKEITPSYEEFEKLVHPEDIELVNQRVKEALDDIKPYSVDARMIRVDGTEWVMHAQGTVYRDKDGKPLRFIGTQQDITERKLAEDALKESEALTKAIFNTVLEGIITIDKDGIVQSFNPASERIFGYSKEDVIGNKVSMLMPEPYKSEHGGYINNYIDTGEAKLIGKSRDVEGLRKDGTIFPLELGVGKMSVDGRHEFVGTISDITERKRAEEQIKSSLREKEILLKEIHHRVKNNLQIVSSILNIQSGYLKDEELQGIFQESQDRIRSMALVHEQLYRAKDISKISLSRYLEALLNNILKSYAYSPSRVELKMEVEDILLDIDTSIILGLIVNELSTNALKYAFPEGSSGELRVGFARKGDKYLLSVSDSGVGLPEDFEIEKADTMGFLLVKSMVAQLGGTLEIEKISGMSFKIKFFG